MTKETLDRLRAAMGRGAQEAVDQAMREELDRAAGMGWGWTGRSARWSDPAEPSILLGSGSESIFGADYQAVAQEPSVAVAAAQLRELIAEEKAAFWKDGADGRRVYHSHPAWLPDGPARLRRAEEKLERRVEAALEAQEDFV